MKYLILWTMLNQYLYIILLRTFLKIRRETITKPNVSYLIPDSLFSLEDQDRASYLSLWRYFIYFILYNSHHRTLTAEGNQWWLIIFIKRFWFIKILFKKKKFLPYLSQKKEIRNIYYRKQDRKEWKNDQQ